MVTTPSRPSGGSIGRRPPPTLRGSWPATDPTPPRCARHPRRLALAVQHGDDAARALLRHGRLAQPLLAAHGRPAARALATLSPRNARRLAILDQSGDLARIGRTEAVLALIGRQGDRAMDFLWRHKGALAVGAVLAAFLADPGPFLDGTRDLAEVAVAAAVPPVAEVPGQDRAGGPPAAGRGHDRPEPARPDRHPDPGPGPRPHRPPRVPAVGAGTRTAVTPTATPPPAGPAP